MTPVVIGIGNVYRRDDGIGPAVAAEVDARRLPGVRVVRCVAETTELLDAWTGAELAIIVDAIKPDATLGGEPGRLRHCALEDFADATQMSSHELGLRHTYELARTLDRAPDSVRVVTVEVADTGHGVGLSPAVQAALPDAARLVQTLIVEQTQETADEQS